MRTAMCRCAPAFGSKRPTTAKTLRFFRLYENSAAGAVEAQIIQAFIDTQNAHTGAHVTTCHKPSWKEPLLMELAPQGDGVFRLRGVDRYFTKHFDNFLEQLVVLLQKGVVSAEDCCVFLQEWVTQSYCVRGTLTFHTTPWSIVWFKDEVGTAMHCDYEIIKVVNYDRTSTLGRRVFVALKSIMACIHRMDMNVGIREERMSAIPTSIHRILFGLVLYFKVGQDPSTLATFP